MSRASQARWDRLAHQLMPLIQPATLGGLVLIVVGSVMAIGAVHPPVLGLAALVGALCLGGAMLLGPRRIRDLPPATLVFWALAAFSLLQLVPLPLGVLAWIAPTNADVWARSLMPFGETPTHAPITLDPGATWIEVARWISYGAVVAAAAAIARRRGLRWAALLVHGAAIAAAIATIGHGLAGATEVFGIYTPSARPQPWHVGPLLNPNNLSGLLNIGALCGLGLIVDEEPPIPRWLLAPSTGTIVAISVASASRAGVLMLFVGVVALALMTEHARYRRRVSSDTVRRARWIGSAALALGFSLALLGTKQDVWDELLDENLNKLALISWAKPAIADYAWLGMGRGAFESGFASYTPAGSHVTVTHAENFVVQWLVEWGAIAGGLGLLAMIYLFRPKRYGIRHSRVAAGAWIGMLILLAQNLVDLGLEVPALCFTVALLLGALEGNTHRRRSVEDEGLVMRPRPVITGGVVAASLAAMLTVVCVWRGFHDLPGDKQRLTARLRAQPTPRTPATRAALRGELRDLMARHPAEPYFPLVGGLIAWEERDQNPLPWLQRALERRMTYGRTHLLLAMVLERAGARSQALLELRLAIESDLQTLGPAARLAVRWIDDIDQLDTVVPSPPNEAAAWDAFAGFAKDRELGKACDERALALDPRRTAPRWRLAQDIIAQRRADGCRPPDEGACAAAVEAHAAAIEQVVPKRSEATQLRATWLAATGANAEAETLLKQRCNDFTDLTACLQLRATIASQLEQPEPFVEAVTVLRHASCLDAERCATANTWIGDAHFNRGEHAAAVAAYERAIRDRPSDERFMKLANAATEAGLDTQALRALERISAAHNSPDVKARVEALRRKLVDHVVNR